MTSKPWENEPNDERWGTHGLHCRIHRNPYGALCGYVGVPKGHPFHGLWYDAKELKDIQIHGGITFADHVHDEDQSLWFCCGGAVYRTIEYVRNEVESLAMQLKRTGERLLKTRN